VVSVVESSRSEPRRSKPQKNPEKNVGSNQKIENQPLSTFWKSSWDYLVKAHAEGQSPEARTPSNREMWTILKKV